CEAGYPDYDEEAGWACVEELRVSHCELEPSDLDGRVGDEFDVFARMDVSTAGGEAVEPTDEGYEGLVVEFCFAPEEEVPPHLMAYDVLSCKPTGFDGERYTHTTTFASSGVWQYVFAVSTDGGSTWGLCGRGGI